MARKRKDYIPETPADGIANALQNPATAKALGRRGRRLFIRGAVSAILVFSLNYVLHQFFANGGVIADAVAVVLIGAFFGFMSTVWGYFGLLHTRQILRANPWVEWYAQPRSIELFGREVARVVTLAHPDWTHEVTRTIHPLSAARRVVFEGPANFWAAGNPARTMAVSPVGGELPMHAINWKLGFILRKLKSPA